MSSKLVFTIWTAFKLAVVFHVARFWFQAIYVETLSHAIGFLIVEVVLIVLISEMFYDWGKAVNNGI